MQLTNLDELLELTCNRIEYLDNFKRSPCEGLLLSMYDAVEKDFKDQIPYVLSDIGHFTENADQSDDITIVIIRKK